MTILVSSSPRSKTKWGVSGDCVRKSEALETHFPTPIFADGYLYGVHGGSKHGTGIVCVDLKTGEQKWRVFPDWSDPAEVDGKGLPVPAGPYRASMVRADGAFLILGEDGHLAWADLSPAGYKELTRARLFRAKETWTGPVISRGLLYICQNSADERAGTPSRLLCYDLRAAR